jgi:molybdopterin/thiamine biosynthesis adenylyltransferase
LHTNDAVGTSKVESAGDTLKRLNPDINVVTHETRLDSSNAENLFSDYDLIIDGTDNFPTRYLINDACVKLGLPNVHGSVYRFEGQVTVFWPAYKKQAGPCYRCLYPEPPPPDMAPSCADAGVLGAVPGIIGLLEAIEALKILLDIGEPLVGRLLCYDALKVRFSELKLSADKNCHYCSNPEHFPGYIDYEHFCTQPRST